MAVPEILIQAPAAVGDLSTTAADRTDDSRASDDSDYRRKLDRTLNTSNRQSPDPQESRTTPSPTDAATESPTHDAGDELNQNQHPASSANHRTPETQPAEPPAAYESVLPKQPQDEAATSANEAATNPPADKVAEIELPFEVQAVEGAPPALLQSLAFVAEISETSPPETSPL